MRDGVSGDFKLVPRKDAVVSVFDSNFLVGDGIWVWHPPARRAQ
jgi:branched-chain amino acid aminotransferase